MRLSESHTRADNYYYGRFVSNRKRKEKKTKPKQ